MKSYWTRASLSRDFILLAAITLFLLFLISSWVTYATYTSYSDRIAADLKKEAARIEHTLGNDMDSASYMLNALGKQIVLDNDRNLTKIATVLKSFDSKGNLYSIFSWVSQDQHVVVSSNRGVLEHPVDVSDRDYVQESMADPWKMHIGRPIEGRVSERWVIPVAMGLTDYTGKFIGTIMISLDIQTLTGHLNDLLKHDGISFAIVSKTLIPLTQVSDDKDFVSHTFPLQKLDNVNFSDKPNGLITQGSLFWGSGSYYYYQASGSYPYILLLGYDARMNDDVVRSMLWSRLLQLGVIAVFLVTFLWIMRMRMIAPVSALTNAAEDIVRGTPYAPKSLHAPEEIRALSLQLQRISEYIEETKRVEDELRHKLYLLKKGEEK